MLPGAAADVNGSAAFAKFADTRSDFLSGLGATAFAKLTGALPDLLSGPGPVPVLAFFSPVSSLAMAAVCNSLFKESLFKEAPQPARSPALRITANAGLPGRPFLSLAISIRKIARDCMCAFR